MNKYHQEILKAIKVETKENPYYYRHSPKSYDGHNDLTYPLNKAARKKITKKWLKKHPQLSQVEFINLLNSLYKGKSSDEKSIAGTIIGDSAKLRKQVDPQNLDRWLNNLQGWSQIDSLCQSNFTADDLLLNWNKWKKLIKNFSKNSNINKRRASLVLLVKPVRTSTDKRFADLALETIGKLKTEKDILITKAISWLLREMIKNHRNLVKPYLEKNINSLPKIVIRETKNKLKTGKK